MRGVLGALLCKKEMPELDNLYQRRKEEGFIVFGSSMEDAAMLRRFITETVSVSYPLLTVNGNVPTLYRDIERWPAIFLIDRQGRLQPAPEPGQPFEKLEAAVDTFGLTVEDSDHNQWDEKHIPAV